MVVEFLSRHRNVDSILIDERRLILIRYTSSVHTNRDLFDIYFCLFSAIMSVVTRILTANFILVIVLLYSVYLVSSIWLRIKREKTITLTKERCIIGKVR